MCSAWGSKLDVLLTFNDINTFNMSRAGKSVLAT